MTLKGAELQSFINSKMNRSFDSCVPYGNPSLETLSPEAIKNFKSYATISNVNAEKLEVDTYALLQKLNLLSPNGELTNAAILAFSNEPRRLGTQIQTLFHESITTEG